MVTRSFSLPLLAVIVAFLAGHAVAQDVSAGEKIVSSKGIGPDRARLTFVNAYAGSGPLDLSADGRIVEHNVKVGRALKPKSLHAEGYSLDVSPAKVGLPLIDNYTANLLGGHDYTFVAYGDVNGTSPTQALLMDVPGALVPKDTVQIIFTNAALDAELADLVIDDVVVYSSVAPGSYQGPQAVNAGKHRLEVRVNGHPVISTNAKNIKGGQTLNLVLYGTTIGKDSQPLKLVYSRVKTR
jgi:hypothetical protein